MPTVGPQEILDQTVAAINGYQTQVAETIMGISSAANLMGVFTPTVQPEPSLAAPGELAVPTLTPMASVDVSLTDPNKNPYAPLSKEALPQYAAATYDSALQAQMLGELNALTPTLFDWLEQAIKDIVESGGQNVSTEVQDAVFYSGRERSKQVLQDALDLAGARVGAKGFRYPNSMLKAAQQELIKSWQNNYEDYSRKVVETMANFAQRNIEMAIGNGVRIDEARVSVFTALTRAKSEIYQLCIDKYKSELSANLQAFDAAVKVLMTDLEVQKMDREEMRAFISMQREQLELKSRVAVSEFEGQLKLDVTTAELQKYGKDLIMQGNDQKIRSWAAYVQQLTEIMRIDLSEVQERNKLRLNAAETTASAYGTIVQSLGTEAVALVKS